MKKPNRLTARILATILTLTMVFSMMPFAAFAEAPIGPAPSETRPTVAPETPIDAPKGAPTQVPTPTGPPTPPATEPTPPATEPTPPATEPTPPVTDPTTPSEPAPPAAKNSAYVEVYTGEASFTYGEAVWMQATVTTPYTVGAPVPTGAVEFLANGNSLGTVTLDAAGVAKLTLPIGDKRVVTGEQKITAVYAGDTATNAATGEGALTLMPAKLKVIGISAISAIDKVYDGTKRFGDSILEFVGTIGEDRIGAYGVAFVTSADADAYTKADIQDITLVGEDLAYYEIAPIVADLPCALTIHQAPLKDSVIVADIPPQKYTGQAVTPQPAVTPVLTTQELLVDLDYQMKYVNNVDGGTAEAVVVATPTGNYTGEVRKQFIIQQSESVTEVHTNKAVYTYGENIEVTATVKLKTRLSVASDVTFYLGTAETGTFLGSVPLIDGMAGGIIFADDQPIPIGDNQLITAVYAGDPSLSGTTGTTTISMKPKELVAIGVGTQSKQYDQNPDFAAGEKVYVKGIVGKDIISVTGKATVDAADAGIYRVADVSDIAFTGPHAGFYTMAATAANVPGVLTIEPKNLTVEKGDLAISKEYDGTNIFLYKDVTGALAPIGVLPGDTVTVVLEQYSTEPEPCVDVGKHKMSLRYALAGASNGNYALLNDLYENFEVSITPKPLTDKMIADIPQQLYVAGALVTPTPVVTDGTPSIIAAKDYNVRYTDNDVPGIGTVYVTAAKRSNYSGTASKTFVIKADSDIDVYTDEPEYIYGEDVILTAEVTMKKDKAAVVQPVVEFFSGDAKGTSLGTATVDATGKATLTVKTIEQKIPTGNSTITAVYSGDGELNTGMGSTAVVLNKKEIKTILGAVARDRDYDGTKNVEIVSLKLDPKEVFDPKVNVSGEGVIPSGDVGQYSNIKADVSALTLDELGAKWYSIAPTAKAVVIQGPLVITPKTLTAAIGTLVVTKEYDGTTKFTDKNATGALALVGLADKADKVTAKIIAYGAAPNKNADIQKIAVRFLLEGADSANYTSKDDLFNLEATITPKTLTGTAGDLKIEKVYDGTTKFTDKNLTGTIDLTGFVDKADKVTAKVTEYGEAMNKNAGTQKMAVRFGLEGADSGNYMLKDDIIKLEATVTPKELTAAAGDLKIEKEYDGTTKFTDKNTTGALALVGLADKADKVTAKIIKYGAAPNKNAGTQKMAVRFLLEGADSANYTSKDDLFNLEATITPKTLTGTAGDLKLEKVYDGTTKFTDKNLTGTIALTGFVDKADKVTAKVTEYGAAPNKNAGTQKMAVRFGLEGADRGNYMLKDDIIKLEATVTPKELTAAAGDFKIEKEYDGTTKFTDKNATGALALVGLADKADKVTAKIIKYGVAPNKNAGTQKMAVRFLLEGADSGNYTSKDDLFKLEATVTQKPLADSMMEAIPNQKYTGELITPIPKVTDGTPNAIAESDYELSYTDNVKKGTGTVHIAATKAGNYSGTASKTFVIEKAEQADSPKAFVEQMYQNVFGRAADAAGLEAWTKGLADKTIDGATFAKNFIFSKEYENKNASDAEYLTMLYAAFFGREPDANGFAVWLKVLENGASRELVLKNFVEAQEYKNVCAKLNIAEGAIKTMQPRDENLNITAFTNRLYQICLGRRGEEGGLNAWTNVLNRKVQTPKDVAHGFVFSKEFMAKNYSNTDYVKQLYRALMGREADAGGLENWVTALDSGKMNRETVFGHFADSKEFGIIQKSFGL